MFAVALFLAAGGYLGVLAFSFSGDPVAVPDGCHYMGDTSALPNEGLPVLPYANASTAPSGDVGVSDGTSYTYVQATGDASGAQVEAKSATAGESEWVNTDGNMGAC
jgi:hypothetical protein